MLMFFACTMAVLCLSAGASSGDISGMQLGTHVSGPIVHREDFPGRAVVFVNWDPDSHDGGEQWVEQCIGWQATYGDCLIVIINDVYGGADPLARNAWARFQGGQAVSFYHSGDADIGEGCVVYDHLGHRVHRAGVDQTAVYLKTFMKQIPGGVVGHLSFQHFAREARLIARFSRPLGSTLAKIRQAAEGSDMAEVQEAQTILDALRAYVERRQEDLEYYVENNATLAYMEASRLAKLFSGDPLGEAFAEVVRAFKEDKGLRMRIKAEAALEDCRAKAFAMGLDSQLEAALNNASNRRRLVGMAKTCMAISEQFAGTKTAAEAEAILRLYRLDQL